MPPGIACTKMQRRRVHTPQHSQTKPHSRCECALCFGRLAPTRTSRARGQENLITARLANGSARSRHAHGQPRHGDTHTHTHLARATCIAARRAMMPARRNTLTPKFSYHTDHKPTRITPSTSEQHCDGASAKTAGTHMLATRRCMRTGCCTNAAEGRTRNTLPRAAPHGKPDHVCNNKMRLQVGRKRSTRGMTRVAQNGKSDFPTGGLKWFRIAPPEHTANFVRTNIKQT